MNSLAWKPFFKKLKFLFTLTNGIQRGKNYNIPTFFLLQDVWVKFNHVVIEISLQKEAFSTVGIKF